MTWLVNLVAMLLVVCQLNRDGYEDLYVVMSLVRFASSIVTVKQSFISQIVGYTVIVS